MNHQTTDTGNDSATSKDSLWIRLVYMILFLIVFSISESIVVLTTLVAFVFRLFGNPVPAGVLYIGKSFAGFLQQVILFLTFNSEERPFPFSPWPDGSPKPESTPPSDQL